MHLASFLIVQTFPSGLSYKIFKETFLLFGFIFLIVIFVFYYVTLRERQLTQNVLISMDPDYVSNHIIYRYSLLCTSR